MKAINLLPPDLRGAPKGAAPVVAADESGGLGAFVVLGALALCVAALAAYVLTTNTVNDREAKLEAVGAQAQATAQRVAQLKPYADFQAMAETRIQTVRDLASSRFDWEQALRDISRAVPSNVTLTQLNGSISGQAGGGSSMRGAISAPAVELKGCTTGQKSVASLLSRLRNVDGVTRVTLGKSLKPDAVAGAGVVAVAPGGANCGAGRPPAFELVIFFERSEVPETVQDVTVQPQAQTTGTPGAAPETQPAAGGVTTPPADPAETPAGGEGTATPASTPQGAGS